MCYTHGKIIDTEETRYSIPMLQKWREMACSRAKFRQEFGAEKQLPHDKLVEIGFADETLFFSSLGKETQVIGEALSKDATFLSPSNKLSLDKIYQIRARLASGVKLSSFMALAQIQEFLAAVFSKSPSPDNNCALVTAAATQVN